MPLRKTSNLESNVHTFTPMEATNLQQALKLQTSDSVISQKKLPFTTR